MVNIIICDDDLSFQEILKCKVEHSMKKDFEIEYYINCVSNLDDFARYIDKNRVDIAFLDIMVNNENSMNWSINNLTNKYTQLIFMTSFPQCAYNISETNCCYYLDKSRLTPDALSKSLKRALQNSMKKDSNLTIVKSGSKRFVVNFKDVYYIETFNNNITIHLKDNKDITLYTSLNDYAKNLPPNFYRCHKSFMVNMNHIEGYEPHKFTLTNKISIPIPPKKYKETIKYYENYLLKL